MKLFHLMYVSIASWPMSSDDLFDMVHTSRMRNKSDEITGALLYGNGRFLHILEGENSKVYDLFNRICRDQRHCGVSILVSRPAQSRVFPEWTMGLINFDAPIEHLDLQLRKRVEPIELFKRQLDPEFVTTIQSFILHANCTGADKRCGEGSLSANKATEESEPHLPQ